MKDPGLIEGHYLRARAAQRAYGLAGWMYSGQNGDVAFIPFGYRGPSTAAPDNDLYDRNVTAVPEAPEQAK